jgi:uncharacterized membrane protein YkgB
MSDIDEPNDAARKLENIGHLLIRYGIVIAVLWIGSLKYTLYEDKGIEGLLVNSPLFAWAHHSFGLRALCTVIGTTEIILAFLVAIRPFSPKLSLVGSLGMIVMFLTTLSFMLTTPGTFQPEGFPFLSGDVGEFLIKDIALLGGALWMTGDCLRAIRNHSTGF